MSRIHPAASLPVNGPDPRLARLRLGVIIAVLAFFFLAVPALALGGAIDPSSLNRLGRYLAFALVAIGIDLVWGYTGMLSLCQALFFCLGGYCMGMHLCLAEGGGDVRPEFHDIPAFFYFNDITVLPAFWQPFRSRTLAIIAVLVVPATFAALFGYVIFRSRVKGVYFSIVTQALAWAALLAFNNQKLLLGGTNGMTNFYKPMNSTFPWILGLYLATATILLLAYLGARHLVRSRAGRVLVAIRDNESRLRFSGFQPVHYKVFVFAVGALLAAVGGMLYAPQTGVIGPSDMNIDVHIMMVIWVAVGGRGRLWGALLGALLVNYAYSCLTSDLPSAWPFLQGTLFLLVVLLFPDGCVKLWDRFEERLLARERAWLALLPLALVVVFLFTEGLGLTRLWGTFHGYWNLRVPLGVAVPLKYLLLGAALAGVVALDWWLGRPRPTSGATAATLEPAP
jgi:urea transport system permease protein